MTAIPETTSRWVLAHHNSPDASDPFSTIELEQSAPIPALKPNQVLVKIAYASLNYRDLLITIGRYGRRPDLPRILGSDASGTVVATGSDVKDLKQGDKVLTFFFANNPTGYSHPGAGDLGASVDGVYAKYAVLEVGSVLPVPSGLSLSDAATLACAGITAWTALFGYAGTPEGEKGWRSLEGETVLVQGTGGVSLFAAQIAKASGATVIATTSSAAKEEKLKALAVDHIINYKTTPSWGAVARSLTPNNKGVDHIIEVGGANTLSESFAAVAPGGVINIIGIVSGIGKENQPDLISLIMNQARIRGIQVGNREGYEQFIKFLVEKDIKPVVDEKRFSFEEFKEALKYLESGKHQGKIIVEVDPAQE